ncbi:MAG: hypothetical protein Q7Q71_01160 [Verrucomicrobiota bacterium JB023]|nr:hypothetical protein [Verrucomicrobiota bacterium JB023]
MKTLFFCLLMTLRLEASTQKATLELSYLKGAEAIKVLTQTFPLSSPQSSLTAEKNDENIITIRSSSLRQLATALALLSQLDRPNGTRNHWVYQVTKAQAERLATEIADAKEHWSADFSVIADPHSNRLFFMGTEGERHFVEGFLSAIEARD